MVMIMVMIMVMYTKLMACCKELVSEPVCGRHATNVNNIIVAPTPPPMRATARPFEKQFFDPWGGGGPDRHAATYCNRTYRKANVYALSKCLATRFVFTAKTKSRCAPPASHS